MRGWCPESHHCAIGVVTWAVSRWPNTPSKTHSPWFFFWVRRFTRPCPLEQPLPLRSRLRGVSEESVGWIKQRLQKLWVTENNERSTYWLVCCSRMWDLAVDNTEVHSVTHEQSCFRGPCEKAFLKAHSFPAALLKTWQRRICNTQSDNSHTQRAYACVWIRSGCSH